MTARVKKSANIGQFGFGVFLKQACHDLQRQLGGHFALRVPSHAIGQQKDRRLFGMAITHPIFVIFSPTFAAELKD